MPQTLAQMVRAKHPGAYDDIGDVELEAKVRAKFPGAYDDLPSTAKPQPYGDTLTASIGEHLGKAFEATNPLSAIQQAPDFARGAMAGAASTVLHGGDWLRQGLGMERIIDRPGNVAAMQAPATPAGEAGKFAEQAAEFAVPLGRVAKGVAKLPWLARVGAEGAAGAGVAGVQSGGDPVNMAIGAVAPAGLSVAGKGAVGVARGVAGAARTATGRLQPRVLATQALRPRNTRIKFADSLDRGLPLVGEAEVAMGKQVDNLKDFIEAVKVAKTQNRAQYNTLRGQAAGELVDLSPAADAMEKSVPLLTKVQRPAAAARVQALADKFRRKVSVEEADELLRDLNAKLATYENKFPAARGSDLLRNPETAMDAAAAREVRTELYKVLDAPGGGDAARELQKRWGSLHDLEDAAWRRQNVAARQAPDNLTEQLSKVGAGMQVVKAGAQALRGNLAGASMDLAMAAGGRAVARYAKEQQTTDALIRRAMQAVRKRGMVPGRIEMPPPPVPRPVPVRQGEIVEPQPQVAGPAPYAEGQFYEPAQRALPPPARPMAPSGGGWVGPDPSYVRAVPATPARTMRQPLALPAPPSVRAMPASSQAPKDPSYVRALQGKYAEKVERRPPTMTAEEYAEIDRLRLVQPEEAGRADWNVEHSIKPPQMFQAVLDDAKKHGFAGSPRELRSLYNQAVEDANSVMASMASAQKGGYHPDLLLQEIRRRGGLNIAKEEAQKGGGGLAGELKWFAEGARGKGGRAGGNLGSGIVRTGRFASDRGGLDVDNMATQLQQIPALAPYIKDANDLLVALRDAHTFYMTGGSAKTGRMSLPKALEFMGVRPGTNWWKQAAKQLEEEISFPPLE